MTNPVQSSLYTVDRFFCNNLGFGIAVDLHISEMRATGLFTHPPMTVQDGGRLMFEPQWANQQIRVTFTVGGLETTRFRYQPIVEGGRRDGEVSHIHHLIISQCSVVAGVQIRQRQNGVFVDFS